MAFPAVPGGIRLCTAACGQSADTARWLFVQCLLDALPSGFFLARNAFGVDLEKDSDAVPRPLGDLGGWHAAVEPRRYGRVAQIVRTFRQLRGRGFVTEDLLAGYQHRTSRPAHWSGSGDHEPCEASCC